MLLTIVEFYNIENKSNTTNDNIYNMNEFTATNV